MSETVAFRLREVGDSALVLELGERRRALARIDIDLSLRSVGIAGVVHRQRIAGVRDVVPTFRSVVVSFDPLTTEVGAVAAALRAAANNPPEALGRTHEVRVAYGGIDGPDLDAVAAFARCSPEAVIARHAGRAYRVGMLGFLPGFAYMASVDESIAAPRHRSPRLRVPARSVGIAGQQTGIYPRESPGGWQIIGRADVDPFDVSRVPPACFAPGDEVRFVPLPAGALVRAEPRATAGDRIPDEPSRSVTVLRPGLLTTVQDSGRWGYQTLGVSPAGPMDRNAHRLANAIVGNGTDAAALEATCVGPDLRLEQGTRLAVAGADLRASLDGAAVPLQTPVLGRAGSVLRVGERRAGARTYIAFAGGVAVPPVLGCRATHVMSGLGGFQGRPLRSGDRLPLGSESARGADGRVSARLLPAGGARLRILPGPQADEFEPSALALLQRRPYTIAPQSDRMGYRLTGGELLASTCGGEMLSDAAFLGGLQVPPSGNPILLMADHPTTGGYPQIAVVITADLPVAGQLAPGDWVAFELCSRAEAIAAIVAEEGRLLGVR